MNRQQTLNYKFRNLNVSRIINKPMVFFMLQTFLGVVGSHGITVQAPV